MSRIGRQAIEIPQGVNASLDGLSVKVKGPLGELFQPLRDEIGVELAGNQIKVVRKLESRRSRELHGLTRTLIANMVEGVSRGFSKRLEISGIGYRAEIKGNSVILSLGYSHTIDYPLPKGIKAVVEKQTDITIKGADKQLVGQVAADIRALRVPEPYKGKGIKYADEIVRRKAGKAGKAGAVGAGAGGK